MALLVFRLLLILAGFSALVRSIAKSTMVKTKRGVAAVAGAGARAASIWSVSNGELLYQLG